MSLFPFSLVKVRGLKVIHLSLFFIRCWILYFQKIQFTEEPVQTRPFTSQRSKSVVFCFDFFFVLFQKCLKIHSPDLLQLLNLKAVLLRDCGGNCCVKKEKVRGFWHAKFTPLLRIGDHRHGNRKATAGVRLVGSCSSSQLPRWPPHGPGVVPAMW